MFLIYGTFTVISLTTSWAGFPSGWPEVGSPPLLPNEKSRRIDPAALRSPSDSWRATADVPWGIDPPHHRGRVRSLWRNRTTVPGQVAHREGPHKSWWLLDHEDGSSGDRERRPHDPPPIPRGSATIGQEQRSTWLPEPRASRENTSSHCVVRHARLFPLGSIPCFFSTILAW